MPEMEAHVLWQALQFEGLIWLITAALLAGFVRGFSGFGSALIFMPLAGQFLPPLWCVMTLVAMDIFGPVPNLPRAYRDGRPMMILWMILGMGLALPLGLLVLGQMDTLLFRYLVSGIALSALLALIAGVSHLRFFLDPKGPVRGRCERWLSGGHLGHAGATGDYPSYGKSAGARDHPGQYDDLSFSV